MARIQLVDPAVAEHLLTPRPRPTRRSPQTFYVDHATGNDANDGLSPQTAWATLAHVETVGLIDGDTLLLHGGQTHPGGININYLGAAATGVRVSSYGGGRGTILPAETTGEYAIAVRDSSRVTIEHINIQGVGCSRSGDFPNAVATWPQRATAIAGIIVWATTSSTWYDDLVIRHCDITGCYNGIMVYAGPPDATASWRRSTIEDVHVTEGGQTGIYFGGSPYGVLGNPARVHDSVVIRDCSAQQIYGDTEYHQGSGYGILVMGDGGGCLIERCYTNDNGLYAWNGTENGSTGIMTGYCDHGVIRECETHYQYDPAAADGNGIDLDVYSVDCLVERCYAAHCHGEGLLTYTASSGSIWRHCIVQRCGHFVSDATRGLAVRCHEDATFVHCSFYGAPTGYTQRLIVEKTAGIHCIYVNNIFGVTAGADFGTMLNPTLVSNCYYVGSGSVWRLNLGGYDYGSLANIQGPGWEMIGGTPHGLTANPLWLDPETFAAQWPTTGTPATFDGFDLDEASPALNTAIDVTTFFALDPGPVDFRGRPLDSGRGTGFSFGATTLLGIVPTITSVTRPIAAQGSQSVTIVGTDFPTPPSVTITGPNAQPISLSVISATETHITVTGIFPLVGTYHVVVSGSPPFPVETAPPVIASVLPSLVSGWAQNQTITIIGSGFHPNPTVVLLNPDGTSRSIGVSSSTANAILATVSFQTPDAPGAPGTYTLTVDDSPEFPLVSVPRPVITAIDPIFHGITETQDITIHGTGFAPGQLVQIDDPVNQLITVRILSVTPTAIVVRGTFFQPGDYTFHVWVADPVTKTTVAKPATITATGPINDDRSAPGSSGGVFGIIGFGFTASQGPSSPPIPVISITDPNGEAVSFDFNNSADTWVSVTLHPPLPPGEYTVTVDGSPPWHQQSIPFTYAEITGVDPAPQAGTYDDQYLTLAGTDFPTEAAPSVIVSDPYGQSVTVAVIPPWTSTSVTIRGVFYADGLWGFRIGQAAIFYIESISPVGPVATVLSVSQPATGSDSEQFLTIQGTLFETPPTIRIYNPSGQLVPFTLLYGSSTTAVISGIFNQAGTWTVYVDNSPPFTIEALPEPATITNVERPQAALDTTQTIQIDGTGFTGEPVVTVTGPSGQPIDVSVISSTATTIAISLPPDLPEGVYTVRADYSPPFGVVALPIPNPTITAVTPPQSGLTISQSVTLAGTWFRDPVSVTVTGPAGAVPVTVTSSSRTSIAISGVFLRPGTYTIMVTADGRTSPPFPVAALPPLPPVITAVQRPQSGVPVPQSVTLTTTGYLTGPVVTVTDPNGAAVPVSVVSAPSAPLGGAITVSGIFELAGAYTFIVDGSEPFSVEAWPPRATITAITPPPQHGSTDSQTVVIEGVHFSPSPTVTVTDPHGDDVPVTILSRSLLTLTVAGVFLPAGTYLFVVDDSAPFPVQTVAPPAIITSISQPQAGLSDPQFVTIVGTNFSDQPVVTVTDPYGVDVQVNVISAAGTVIVIRGVFLRAGRYMVTVDDSQPFGVDAIPPPAPPPFVTHPIRRLRQFALPTSADHRRMFVGRLELLMRTGIGLTRDKGSDPQVMMQLSRDGGKTWSAERWRSAGQTAEYLRRIRWLREGHYRDGVIRFVFSDPVDWQLLSLSGDLTEGSN